jgi:hypothetical protein
MLRYQNKNWEHVTGGEPSKRARRVCVMTKQYFDDDETYFETSNDTENLMMLNTKISRLEFDLTETDKNIVKLNVKVENLIKSVELLRELQSADAFKSQKVV